MGTKLGTKTFILGSVVGLLFTFQNCARDFKATRGLSVVASQNDSEGPGDSNGGKETTTPVTVVPELKSWNDPFPEGVFDSDCMNSEKYNVCLIYRDPFSANGGAFSPRLTTDSSNPTIEAKIRTYGLKVPESGPLENDNFVISDGVNPDAANNNGSWKFPYEDDQNQYVAQISAFYWLNRQVTFMKEYTGAFYFEGKRAPVYAYSLAKPNNASFGGAEITLGYIQHDRDDPGRGSIALEATIIAHEAGHGNLYEVTRGANATGICPDKNGCFPGIHEGQSDVHFFLLFPEHSVIGQYFYNSEEGIRSAARVKEEGVTAQDLYRRNLGNAHDMGEAYSSVWWEVGVAAKNSGGGSNLSIVSPERELAIIFTEHLAGLGENDTFTSAYEVIEAITKKTAPGNASRIMSDFRREYTRLDIDLP